MTITPLADRVLVRVDDNETMTPSGRLHLPEKVRHNVQRATVVAVGPGRVVDGKPIPVNPAIKPGVRILFAKYAGSDIASAMDHHLLLREDDILGTVES